MLMFLYNIIVSGYHCASSWQSLSHSTLAQFDYCASECTKQTKFSEIEEFYIIASIFRIMCIKTVNNMFDFSLISIII